VSVNANLNLNPNVNVNLNVNLNGDVFVHEVCDTADALRVCTLPTLMLHLNYCMHSSKVGQKLDVIIVK